MKGDPLRTQRFHLPRRWRGSSLFAVFLLVLSSFLWPFDLAAAPTVTLQAQVFLASNQPAAAPDPRLATLIAQLRKALPYANFQLLEAPSGRTDVGQSCRVGLPGPGVPRGRNMACGPAITRGEVPEARILELTPAAIDRGAIQVQAKIVQGRPVPETLVNTTLRLQSGGPPVVIGGPAYQNGVLVIVISASTP